MFKMEKMSAIASNPIKNMKEKWNVATPYQKWKLLYRVGLFMEDFVQFRVFSKKPTGLIGYVPVVTCVLHYTLLVYTAYYYIRRGNGAGCLPCFCVFGIITSVSTEHFHGKFNQHKLQLKFFQQERYIIVSWNRFKIKFYSNFMLTHSKVSLWKKEITQIIMISRSFLRYSQRTEFLYTPKRLTQKVWVLAR